MGFSRITVGKKRRRTATKKETEGERKKRTIVSREEDDSQPNLPVGDHVCCVGVKGREEIQRTLFCSFSHSLETPTAQQCHTNENKSTLNFFFSNPKSKDVVLLHRVVLHADMTTVLVTLHQNLKFQNNISGYIRTDNVDKLRYALYKHLSSLDND